MSGMRLGRLLGVPVAEDNGAPLAREELFAGWRLFFERLAAAGPVVLLIEDAQHADAGPAGLPRPSHRLGPGPAGLRAGVRPAGARARPGPGSAPGGTGPR